jgi:hypothetical protein
MPTKIKNRETYLEDATDAMRPMFKAVGAPLPKKIKITCGWPSKSAGRSSKRRIGECWAPGASAAGNVEIIISMVIEDSFAALEILIHELVHAADGNVNGHKGPFRKIALALGLEGKMTATNAGPELAKEIKALVKTLGKYPHSAIDFSNRSKQTTRMVKVKCLSDECGMIFRTSRKWLDGLLNCPACAAPTETD